MDKSSEMKNFNPERVRENVYEVLKMHRVEHLESAYIYTYRSDYLGTPSQHTTHTPP